MFRKQILLLNLIGLGIGSVAQSADLGTAFTYQGHLEKPAGTPVTATCDFRFGLWNAASGESQQGAHRKR